MWSTMDARASSQSNKTQHKGCLDRLVKIDVEIKYLQEEKIVVGFEAACIKSVVAQDQITVIRLESESETMRKQLEDLTTELHNVPDPALILSEAKSAMEAARVAVIRLISGCLEKP